MRRHLDPLPCTAYAALAVLSTVFFFVVGGLLLQRVRDPVVEARLVQA